jgi:DNA-binding NarL/FixJ family response regulator
VIDPQVVESLLARGNVSQRPELSELTYRERDVLREMAQGNQITRSQRASTSRSRPSKKHASAIFARLRLDAGDATVNRRVAAVLAFLQTYGPARLQIRRNRQVICCDWDLALRSAGS